MAERIVTWRAIADFSKVRKEAAQTEASLASLRAQTDATNVANTRLGASENALARDTGKAQSSIRTTLTQTAQARDRATQASERSNAASIQEINSASRIEKALQSVQKAKLQEASASQSLSAASIKVAQANQLVEERTKKAEAATKNYENTLSRANSTTSQIAAAESKVNTAREQSARAVTQQQTAVLSLERAQQRLIASQNSVAISQATVTQQAAKASQEAQQAALKAQAAADKEAKQAATRLENLGKEQQKVVTLKSALSGAIAAREASAAAALRETSSEDAHANSLDRAVTAVRRSAAAKSAYTALSKAEKDALDKVNAAETSLIRVRQAEAVSTGTVNNNIKAVAEARGLEEAAMNRVNQSTARYNEVVDQQGASSSSAIAAEKEMVKAELAHENASTRVRNSIDGLEQSERRLAATHGTVAAAEDKLVSKVRGADNEMRSAGGGGNFLTGVLGALSSAFSEGGAGAGILGAALNGVKFLTIGIGISTLIEGISALISSLFALASAIGPALGALAAIAPVAIAAGTALGTIKLAFSGIGNVLKAYSAQQKASTTSSTKSANTEISNAESIKNAQLSLRDAREQVGLTTASVSDSIAKAYHTEIEAQNSVTTSQKALSQARKDAKKNIDDLKQAIIDAALAERGATLSLEDAKQQLTKTLNDPTATKLQREQAKLAVDQAAEQAKAAVKGSADSKTAYADASKKGVEGSDSVVQAKKAETDAVYSLKQAQLDYTKTVTDGARQNRNSQEAVAKAVQSLADAQRTAVTNTGAAATAANNYAYALDKLTPAGRAFVAQLISMKTYVDKIKATASNSLLPGLTNDLKRLPVLFPVVNQAVGLMGKELSTLADKATDMFVSPPWLKSLDTLGKAGPSIINPFGEAFLKILDVFRLVAVAAIPLAKAVGIATNAIASSIKNTAKANVENGKMAAFFTKAWKTAQELGRIIKNLGQALYNMGKIAGISGKGMLDTIEKLTGKFDNWTKSVKGKNELADFFAKVDKNARVVLSLLGSLGSGFIKAGSSKALKPIIDEIKTVLLPALKNLFGQFNQGDFGKKIIDLIAKVIDVVAKLASGKSGLNTFISVVKTFTDVLFWFVKTPGVAPAIGAIATAMAALAAIKLIGTVTGLGKLTSALSSFLKIRKEAAKATALGDALTFKQKLATSPIQTITQAPGNARTARKASKAARGAESVDDILSGGSSISKSGKAVKGVETGAKDVGKIGKAVKGAGGALKGGVSLLGAASGLGPWGILIAAAVGGLVLLYTKVKWFHDFVNAAWKDIQKWSIWLWNNALKPFFGWLKSGFDDVTKWFSKNKKTFETIFTDIGHVISWLWNNVAKPVFGFLLDHWKLTISLMLGPFGILIANFKLVASIISWLWSKIIQPVWNFISAAFKVLVDVVTVYIKIWIAYIKLVANVIQWLWSNVIQPVWDFISAAFKFLVGVVSFYVNLWISYIKLVASIISWLYNNIVKPIFNLIWNTIKSIITAIVNFLASAWNGIKNTASSAWNSIMGVIASAWRGLLGGLKSAWKAVSGWINGIWSDVKTSASKAWDSIVKAITDSFSRVETGLTNIWNNVKKAFSAALNFVGQSIVNPFINAINAVLSKLPGGLKIPTIGKFADGGVVGGDKGPGSSGRGTAGFAKGGVLPGYTPGRDVHNFYSPTGGRIALSGGEGILVPEAVKALGGASGIQNINHTASRGRVRMNGMKKNNGHFALGGTIGNVWDSTGGKLVTGAKVGIEDSIKGARNVAAWGSKKALEAAIAPLRGMINSIPSELIKNISNGSFNNIENAAYNFIKGTKAKQALTNGNQVKTGPQLSAGLSAAQIGNAQQILAAGNSLKASSRDVEIAYMTAMVESSMRNLANPSVPASMSLPHDGIGSDHDSVGMFQQRNSWGSAAQRLNPYTTSQLFFQRLLGLGSSRLKMTMGQAAQAVQVSAFPDRYDQYQAFAEHLYAQISGSQAHMDIGTTGRGTAGMADGGIVAGFASGGLIPTIQKFHAGGIVKGIGPGNSNNSIASLKFQALTEAPTNGLWTSALTTQARKRLAGVNKVTGVTNNTVPRAIANTSPSDPNIAAFIRWQDISDAKTYDAMWKGNGGSPASIPKNPYFPLQAYESNPAAFTNHKWPLRGKSKDLTVQHLKEEQNSRNSWANTYRIAMGLSGKSAPWTSDMEAPSDHILAHAIGQDHPADWPHPWEGPVSSIQEELAQQDRSNSLNTEWYNDLQILANWGFAELVDELMTKGVADGLDLARSAIADKNTASQLNASIIAGKRSAGGLSTDDQTTVLKAISIIASGSPLANKGLRDVSGTLQVPDYAIVNLYDKMTAQLAALPANLTQKFNNDVGLFRQGLFYAATGGKVPGVGNSDSVPAMLTPGEFVMKKKAVEALGLGTMHNINNLQHFAAGGIVLAPSVQASPSLGIGATRNPSLSNKRSSSNVGGNTYITEINTEIQSTTNDSAYEMTKMLQRKAATGEFNRAAKINGG